MTYQLYTDGGARGNPGPGAIGVVLQDQQGNVIKEDSQFLGPCTNNEAEYLALIFGLKLALKEKIEKLEVFMDSELVVKQIKREYKVKNERLKVIFGNALEVIKSFKEISFTHVKREKNKRADALVNAELDKNGC